MEYAFWIWLYLAVGKLVWVVILAWVVAAALGLLVFMLGIESDFGKSLTFEGAPTDDSRNFLWAKRLSIKAFCLSITLSLIGSLYPSKEDLMWIIGGAGVIHVAQSDEARKLPDNVLRAMNSFLEGVGEPRGSE